MLYIRVAIVHRDKVYKMPLRVATICRVSLSSASSDLLRVDRGIEANDSRTSGPSFPVKDCVGPWKGQL